MVKRIGKVKKAVRSVNREEKKVEAESGGVPRTMIFCKSGASSATRRLTEDLRAALGPYTTSSLKSTRGNKMRDFIDLAGPLGVKNLMYLSEKSRKTAQWGESSNSKMGDIYCHVICVPHGPTFTYKVKEYSLKKDIQTVSGFAMNNNWLQHPPLMILSGFGKSNNKVDGESGNNAYINAVSSSWQNMLPKINVSKTRTQTIRRALLISRHDVMPETDEKVQAEFGEVLVLRHYNIKFEKTELSKSVKKLGIGAASRNVKIPDLGKYGSIEEFITQTGNISESDISDIEESATVELVEQMKELPGSSGKTAIKMMEVGPRITFQLTKIEAGVNSGAVIYHRYIKKTAEEIFAMDKSRQEKLRLKEQRRKEQEKNVAEKNKLKDSKGKKKNKDEHNESDSDEEVNEEKVSVNIDRKESQEEDEEDIDDGIVNESEDIEDINDSLDECDLDDQEEIHSMSDTSSENQNEEDSDMIEEVDDSMDECDSMCEDVSVSDDNSYKVSSLKVETQNSIKVGDSKQTINSLKRSKKQIHKSNKKRRL